MLYYLLLLLSYDVFDDHYISFLDPVLCHINFYLVAFRYLF